MVLKPTITKFRDSIYKVIHAGRKQKENIITKDKKCDLKSPYAHVCYFRRHVCV